MRRYALASALVALSLLAACDRNPPEAAAPAPAPAPAADTATPAVAPQPPAIVSWGPQSTVVGVAANAQKGGESGLWIKANGPVFVRGTIVTFDGKTVENVSVAPSGEVMTMLVPADYIATPGMKQIVVRPGGNGPDLVVGEFEVTQ